MWSIKYLQRSTWHKREKKIEKDDGRISNVTINDAISQKMQKKKYPLSWYFWSFLNQIILRNFTISAQVLY